MSLPPEIEPDLEIALHHMGVILKVEQDKLPISIERLLQMYGKSCFLKGAQYEHDKDTLVTPRHGSAVFPAIADDIAEVLEPDPPMEPGTTLIGADEWALMETPVMRKRRKP